MLEGLWARLQVRNVKPCLGKINSSKQKLYIKEQGNQQLKMRLFQPPRLLAPKPVRPAPLATVAA